jgi:choice-of-anchor A domain-containing protein
MKQALYTTALGFGVLAFLGLTTTNPARADIISAQQQALLTQFNLIDLGTLDDSADIEGRAFVNGNVTGSFTVGLNAADITPSPSGFNTFITNGSVNTSNLNINVGGFTVGGNANNINANNATGTTSTVGGNINNITLNGGTLHYSGTASGNINMNGGATKTQVPGLPTTPLPVSTFSTLSTLSSSLDGLTANSVATVVGNTATFNAVAGANGLAVFKISSALAQQIFSAATIQFNLGSAKAVIIDVDGTGSTSLTDHANFNGASIASDLLWNFVGVNALAFDTEFAGTVLATGASVTNSGPIDGTLVAASANLDGELHSHPFVGVVPEPATPALLLSGLFGLAWLRRARAR